MLSKDKDVLFLTYDEGCKKGSLQSLLAPASTSSHYTAGAFFISLIDMPTQQAA